MIKYGNNNDYTHARVRFFAICNLISNARPEINHFGIPAVEEISRRMNVPLSVIRKDIYNIVTSKYLFRIVYVEGLSDMKDPICHLNDKLEFDIPDYKQVFSKKDKESIKEGFRHGRYDRTHFYLNLFNNSYFDIYSFLSEPENNEDEKYSEYDSDGIIDNQGNIVLFLTKADKDVMNRFMSGLSSKDKQDLMNIKSVDYMFTKKYVEQLNILREAIMNHKEVSIDYKSGSAISWGIIIQPICLIFNYYDQMIHVLCSDEKKYNIKRIIKATMRNKSFIPQERPSFIDFLWASGFSEGEKPIKIKLKIIEPTSNLVNKFLSDTANRKYGQYDSKTGIYTDTILGEAGFRRWLRKYGSSVIVLEPEELAVKMYGSARKQYDVYMKEHPEICKKLSSKMNFDPDGSTHLYQEYLKSQNTE